MIDFEESFKDHPHIFIDSDTMYVNGLDLSVWEDLGKPYCWHTIHVFESPTKNHRIEVYKDSGYGAYMLIYNDKEVVMSHLNSLMTLDRNWLVVVESSSGGYEIDLYNRWK